MELYSSHGQFYQLYFIFGEINGRTYPLVFGLLLGKSEVIYQRFFHLLMNYCGEINVVFQPDCDVWFRNCGEECVATSLSRCHSEGMLLSFYSVYLEEVSIFGISHHVPQQRPARRAASLPLAPINAVEDVWFSTLEDGEEINVDMSRFADYVTEQWRKQVTCWNCMSLKFKHITNNINERIGTFASYFIKWIPVCIQNNGKTEQWKNMYSLLHVSRGEKIKKHRHCIAQEENGRGETAPPKSKKRHLLELMRKNHMAYNSFII